MSTDTGSGRPSFRFRDKFSRMKDRVKEKLRDKAIKHNITTFVHENITYSGSNESYSQTTTTRHGFRQHMHHFKDVLKNKTHYQDIKDKIKEKIDDQLDLDQNKTYPKGFYDSLFSPETENDVYLKTALITLWVIAVLCIIPTIIVIFLPARRKNGITSSSNMIFFHVFFCELCYLGYVLLAMINVAKDFHMGPTLCDIANYGMYVTIPIMQFALLFLSLERLSQHFNLPITCAKVFTKPYLIQVILCAIWIFLIALLFTFMFIKKQFNFNFIKDQVSHLAPPLFEDVVSRLKRRRYHCSVDGRLSSVFKTVIIVLFIILIVKPILISIGMNVITPFCCRKQRNQRENYDERRTTKLVTIFLLLNFFFSFPYYFTSMFKSLFTNIDSTKDTFTIVLKICFILRILNIIFECLAFYIFERNSWDLMTKVFYYGTCKKFSKFNVRSDGAAAYTKDPEVLHIIKKTREASGEDDDDEEEEEKPIRKRKGKVRSEEEDDDDDDDDGAFRKTAKKKSITQTPEETEDEEDEENDKAPVIKSRRKTSIEEITTRKGKKKQNDSDEDEHVRTKKTKSKVKQEEEEDDDDDDEEEDDDDDDGAFKKKPKVKEEPVRRKTKIKQEESEEEEEPVIIARKKKVVKQEESEEEEPVVIEKKKKVVKQEEEVDEDEFEKSITTKKRKPKARRKEEEDNDDDEEEVIIREKKTKPKKVRNEDDDSEERQVKHRTHSKVIAEKDHTPKSKSKSRIKQEEAEEQQEFLEKPKSKPRRPSSDNRIHNGKSTPQKTITSKPQRFRTPSDNESEAETNSQTSQTSQRKSKPIAKKSHQSKSQVKSHSSKKPKKDRQIEILEMSHEV